MNWVENLTVEPAHIKRDKQMKMKTYLTRTLGTAAILLAFTTSLRAEDALTRFDSLPGSKMRIEGTSSIHDWQMESKLIGGYLEAGPGFPTEPAQTVKPGKVVAKVDVFIPVRSLKSIEKDGKAYSDKMDDVMYEKMLEPTNKKILYRLNELELKEPPKAPNTPYVFESKGDLVIAGVTNKISMPVNVMPLPNKKLKITGTTTVKMTQFGIQPPAPAIAMGMIKTGDDVKIIFDWLVGQKPAAPAAPTAAPAK
jgi:hypothetical protein